MSNEPGNEWLDKEPGKPFWATKLWMEEQNLPFIRKFEILEKDPAYEAYLVRIVLR